MCVVENITYVYSDGHRTTQRYERLCDRAVRGRPCDSARYYDLPETMINEPSRNSRLRSSHGSSSADTVDDASSTSTSTSRRGSSSQSAKPRIRTYVGKNAVYRRRDKGGDRDVLVSSSTGERATQRQPLPLRTKAPVVVKQQDTPQSPVTKRPASRLSTVSTSPSDPMIVHRFPDPGGSSRGSPSGRSGSEDRSQHNPASGNKAKAKVKAKPKTKDQAMDSFDTVVPEKQSSDRDTDTEDASSSEAEEPTSDMEPGLRKYFEREKARKKEQRRLRSEERKRLIEENNKLREELASMRQSKEQESSRQDDDSGASQMHRRGESAILIAKGLKSRQSSRQSSDEKGNSRLEGHRTSSGDVVMTQTVRPRASADRDTGRSSLRGAHSASVREQAIVSDDESVVEASRAADKTRKSRPKKHHRG